MQRKMKCPGKKEAAWMGVVTWMGLARILISHMRSGKNLWQWAGRLGQNQYMIWHDRVANNNSRIAQILPCYYFFAVIASRHTSLIPVISNNSSKSCIHGTNLHTVQPLPTI